MYDEKMEFGFKASMEQIMDDPLASLDGFYFSADACFGTVLKNAVLFKSLDDSEIEPSTLRLIKHAIESFTFGVTLYPCLIYNMISKVYIV